MMCSKRLFILSIVIAGLHSVSSSSHAAAILIDFTTDTGNGTTMGTGVQLDVNPNISTDLPFSVDVYDTDPGDLGTVGATGTLVSGLFLTIDAASSFDSTNTTFNASGASFGLNSPNPVGGTENAVRFDALANEVATFSFNQSVRIISVELWAFSNEEIFTLGSITFGNSQFTGGGLALADAQDVFTFDGGGLVLAANEGFSLQADGPADSSVGLAALTIEVIPEPSSTALLGLGGFALILRRKR